MLAEIPFKSFFKSYFWYEGNRKLIESRNQLWPVTSDAYSTTEKELKRLAGI